MSTDKNEKKLVRSHLSSILLDKIDVDRQKYKDMEIAAVTKTINRNRLLFDRIMAESLQPGSFAKLDKESKDDARLINMKSKMEQKVKEFDELTEKFKKLTEEKKKLLAQLTNLENTTGTPTQNGEEINPSTPDVANTDIKGTDILIIPKKIDEKIEKIEKINILQTQMETLVEKMEELQNDFTSFKTNNNTNKTNTDNNSKEVLQTQFEKVLQAQQKLIAKYEEFPQKYDSVFAKLTEMEIKIIDKLDTHNKSITQIINSIKELKQKGQQVTTPKLSSNNGEALLIIPKSQNKKITKGPNTILVIPKLSNDENKQLQQSLKLKLKDEQEKSDKLGQELDNIRRLQQETSSQLNGITRKLESEYANLKGRNAKLEVDLAGLKSLVMGFTDITETDSDYLMKYIKKIEEIQENIKKEMTEEQKTILVPPKSISSNEKEMTEEQKAILVTPKSIRSNEKEIGNILNKLQQVQKQYKQYDITIGNRFSKIENKLKIITDVLQGNNGENVAQLEEQISELEEKIAGPNPVPDDSDDSDDSNSNLGIGFNLDEMIIQPSDNNENEDDWKKFKEDSKEALDHLTWSVYYLISLINANLDYLDQAEMLNDISLNVAEILALQKAEKKGKNEIVEVMRERIEDRQDDRKGEKAKAERKSKRRKKLKDPANAKKILYREKQAYNKFIKRIRNSSSIKKEDRGRPFPLRKTINVKFDDIKQHGGINTELYNNNTDISKNILNLYENKKNISIGRDLYENVVFTGGAIYKLPIGYTKQNQIINNLFKVINKSNKKIKIGGNRPSIIEKHQIGGGTLDDLKTESIAILQQVTEYIKLLDGLQKYYNELIKKTENYNKYMTSLRKAKEFNTPSVFTIGEIKNYLNVMTAITDLWTSIDTWSDISHFKVAKIQKNTFSTIDEKLEIISGLLNSEKTTNTDQEETELTKMRDFLLERDNNGEKYEDIIKKLGNVNLIKTNLNRGIFFTEDEDGKDTGVTDTAKSKILEKFPYIENDEEERIYDIVKEVWKLYDEHYIMIQKWQNYAKLVTSNEDIPAITSYELKIPTNKPSDIWGEVWSEYHKLKRNFVQFSFFRGILDNFQVLTRRPITLYARINDIGRNVLDDKELEKYKHTKKNFPKQSFDKSKKLCDPENRKQELQEEQKFICDVIDQHDYIQWYEKDPKLTGESGILTIDTSQCKEYNSISDKSDQKREISDLIAKKTTIKFEEVFWRPEFDESKNISSYMLLDKLITRNIGTYLVTYGYSGVGKSFTLFGNNKGKKSIPGLLQATVENISTVDNFIGLSLRVYELYGMGLGYSDCWRNYTDIDQSIYHYNIDEDFGSELKEKSLKLNNDCKVIALKGENIPDYIKKIHTYQDKNEFRAKCLKPIEEELTYFRKFSTDPNVRKTTLYNFQNFIEQIEKNRETPTGKFPKRVNATVNNPKSSRAKLIYDFMFEFQKDADKITSPLVIDDTPGAENLIESYITKNKDIQFYIKLAIEEMNRLNNEEMWKYSVLNATLVNPLFAGVVNSAGILTAFNRLISGEELKSDRSLPNIAKIYSKLFNQNPIDFKAINNRVKRMQNLFEMFYNKIKDKRVTVNGPTFKNYVHNNNGEIIFQVIKSGNSYSKICSPIHEQKLFTKYFESSKIHKYTEKELNDLLDDEFQVKPKFKDNEKNSNLESKTMHLAVWLILNLIKFCSKRTISGKTLENNEMKYDMLIELLAYSCDLTEILTYKQVEKRNLFQKWTSLPTTFQKRVLGKMDNLWKILLKKSFEENKKEVAAAIKRRQNQYTNDKKEYEKFYWDSNESDNKSTLIDKKEWRKDKNNKYFSELINDSIPGPKEFVDDYGKVDDYWAIANEHDTTYVSYLREILIPAKTRDGKKEILPKISSRWSYVMKELEKENLESEYKLREVFYENIMFGVQSRRNKEKRLPIIKEDTKLSEAFKAEFERYIIKFADPSFCTILYRYYAKEKFKKYITLAMESWYIDQNISGILKKCSEISGLNYETIIGDITPWQYYNENEEEIYNFAEKAKNEREVVKYKHTKKWDKYEALKQYGVKHTDELDEFDTQENNQVSLGSYLRDIEELIYRLTDAQSLKIVDADLYSIYKQENMNTIKFIQKRYNMTKLFPIKNFPPQIKESNENARKHLTDFEITDDKENKVKKWSKDKIDTIIGVLMDPYFTEESTINIQDYKMFYVLSNNSTQLKCWDQLKTFNMFARFIKKMK